MSTSIYQIQYSDDVVGEFDPAFIKYDCRKNPEPDKREIAHMIRFYEEGIWKNEDTKYFGLLSPKFSSKAKISGQSFIHWINSNPGYDVYFINPFPQLSYWNFNVWTQGEFWHPGLKDLANSLFMSAGYTFRIEDLPRSTIATALYSNYWVGNQKFWDAYMNFVKTIIGAIDKLSDSDKKMLFKFTPHYTPATFFPFIFERLFSTFLILEKNILVLPYAHGHEGILSRCTNEMERFIINEWVEVIDSWDGSDKDDVYYKKFFSNLQGMLDIYDLSQQGVDNFQPVIWKKIFNYFKNILH